jgi:hypothetical protein
MELYQLMDEEGWYRSVIYICGEPWCTKNLYDKDAARYTHEEMLRAKSYFKSKRVDVTEVLVTGEGKSGPVGKTWKKGEKIGKEMQQNETK